MKTQAPPLYPIDLMAYKIGEYWSTALFEFRGRNFVLGIDKASQYMFIEELKNKKTETVTKALEKQALMLGLLTVLKSDSGPCFKSMPISNFVDKYQISHVMTSPYHHQSNSQAEWGIPEAKKMMERLQQFNPYHIAQTLNKMERRCNIGAPMDLFLQQTLRALSPNSQNIILDLVKNESERKKGTLKASNPNTEGLSRM